MYPQKIKMYPSLETSAIANASAVPVECKEFKYASKSDIGAVDSDATLLPLQPASASALALLLDVL